MRARAARHGRTLKFGIRLHVIVRETEDEAWRAAAELISHLDDNGGRRGADGRSRRWTRSASAAWPRCTRAGSTRRDVREGLEIAPNLWAGVGLVRGGAGTALVGDPRAGGGAHRGVRRRSAWTTSSSRATRTWRRPTASPNWCSRCCRSSLQRELPGAVADRAVRRDRGQHLRAAAQARAGMTAVEPSPPSRRASASPLAASPCRRRSRAAGSSLSQRRLALDPRPAARRCAGG